MASKLMLASLIIIHQQVCQHLKQTHTNLKTNQMTFIELYKKINPSTRFLKSPARVFCMELDEEISFVVYSLLYLSVTLSLLLSFILW